jgi:hypothetical protein
MAPKPLNKQLYNKVKSLADKKFKTKTSIYKSSWITKEYKKRGGTYSGNKSNSLGLSRWYREKWVDLNRPIYSGNKIIGYKPCGRQSVSNGEYPLCRPSVRVSKKTPLTISEISKAEKKSNNYSYVQFHGKKSSVMIKVPSNVKKYAKYAFKLKKLGFTGATSTGWKRAKQLATKSHISIEDLRFMRNWYARHIKTSYPGFKKWIAAGRPKDSSWFKTRSILSWLTWGGNAGFNWVNSKNSIMLLNKHSDGPIYKKITTSRLKN